MRALEHAVLVEPSNANAHSALGVLLEGLRRPASAERNLNRDLTRAVGGS